MYLSSSTGVDVSLWSGKFGLHLKRSHCSFGPKLSQSNQEILESTGLRVTIEPWPWWIFAAITSFANTSIGEAGATMSTWSWKSLATLGSSATQGKVTGSWPGKAVGEATEIQAQADVVSRSKWGTSVAVLVSGCGTWTLPRTMAGGSPAPMAAGASCR